MLTRKVLNKNSYNVNIFCLNEKNKYDKNACDWIQICFDWIKVYFDIAKEKGDTMKYILLNTNLFWLNKYLFRYHKKMVI